MGRRKGGRLVQMSMIFYSSNNQQRFLYRSNATITKVLTFNTPVAWEGGGHALCTTTVSVTVEEGEVCGHKVGPVVHTDRQDGGEVALRVQDDG